MKTQPTGTEIGLNDLHDFLGVIKSARHMAGWERREVEGGGEANWNFRDGQARLGKDVLRILT